MEVSTPSYMEAGSSSPISSPPLSIQGKDEIALTNTDYRLSQPQLPLTAKQNLLLDQAGDATSSDTPSSVLTATATAQSVSVKGGGGGSTAVSTSTTAKKPRQRKPKEEGSGSATGDGAKPARKPRKPRDPDAPPRKRAKKGEEGSALALKPNSSFGVAANSQPGATPTSMAGFVSSGSNGQVTQTNASNLTPPRPIQPQPPSQSHVPSPSQAQPQSRGQRFDPIRSASLENARLASSSSPGPPKLPQSPPHSRPGASIASLIDPPHPPTSISVSVGSPLKPVEKTSTGLASPIKVTTTESSTPSVGLAKIANGVVSKQEIAKQDANAKQAINGKSASSSRAVSPKPPKKRKDALPLPSGNEISSGSSLGKSDNAERVFAEVPNQCIVIEVPITGQTGNYVNFMREVENKYGFDVAHPRLAEHRRRMAEMAAAGAAIESGAVSGDEMALDGSDVDSNVEMDGVEEEGVAEGASKKKKPKRGNEYDKNDEFIDDTEQAWEEQAMASRDGYFVWSGPLVQEEDKPNVEKTEGPARRSRGGRGGRGGASRGESSGRGGRGSGTRRGSGTGTGSRGGRGGSNGSTTRKPRMTKAEQKEREAEKAAREKVAATLSKEPAVPTGIIGM